MLIDDLKNFWTRCAWIGILMRFFNRFYKLCPDFLVFAKNSYYIREFLLFSTISTRTIPGIAPSEFVLSLDFDLLNERVASNPHDFSLHSHATATLSSFGAPLIVQKRRDERPAAADRHYQRYDAKVCIKYVVTVFSLTRHVSGPV